MRLRNLVWMVPLAALFAGSSPAPAAVPPFINYHGYLTDLTGDPLSGPHDLEFAFYADSTGGAPFWSELHPGVEVAGGAFAVLLGSLSPLDPEDLDGSTVWIETTVDDSTLAPRRPMVSVGYAFRAARADTALGLASGGPIVVRTADTRVGCPPIAPVNTNLILQNLALDATAAIMTSGHMIRNATGRSDLQLYVDGTQVNAAITYTPTQQWDTAKVQWSGVLGPGAHTIALRCPDTPNAWGCGATWGAIDTIVLK